MDFLIFEKMYKRVIDLSNHKPYNIYIKAERKTDSLSVYCKKADYETNDIISETIVNTQFHGSNIEAIAFLQNGTHAIYDSIRNRIVYKEILEDIMTYIP